MICINGELISKENKVFGLNNRAFKFGDGLFETIKVLDNKVVFLEDHYFRLMASMRMIRMNIPMEFNMEYFENEILKTVEENELVDARVRFSVYRSDGGLYNPLTNNVSFVVEVTELAVYDKGTYIIDLFKDHYLYSGLLSTIKTNNKLINVLASVFASENKLDNCILLNDKKNISEVINGNLFLIFGKVIKTPALTEGCVKGIIRKKLINIIEKQLKYTIEETSISPFDLQKADEVFITNSIIGIQSVTNYRKTTFKTNATEILQKELKKLI